jgi:hypothetical protein
VAKPCPRGCQGQAADSRSPTEHVPSSRIGQWPWNTQALGYARTECAIPLSACHKSQERESRPCRPPHPTKSDMRVGTCVATAHKRFLERHTHARARSEPVAAIPQSRGLLLPARPGCTDDGEGYADLPDGRGGCGAVSDEREVDSRSTRTDRIPFLKRDGFRRLLFPVAELDAWDAGAELEVVSLPNGRAVRCTQRVRNASRAA